MKTIYSLMLTFAAFTNACGQILQAEQDPKTGQTVRSAVTVLAGGMGRQLNFFARGDEKLIELVDGFALEIPPAKILHQMVISVKLKNDSIYRFPTDSTKFTVLNDYGFQRLSFVAVVQEQELMPFLSSPLRSISLSAGDKKGTELPPLSENNRTEIKRAVAYITSKQ